jgi:mitochondrial import inner membrane translocase subunit TIM50
MLGRAILPLLRPRALPSPIRLSLAVQQSRYYGRNKPRVPSEGYKIPDSARTANRYPLPTQPYQRQDSDAEPLSEVQPEFETSSASDANTAPEPTATFARGTRSRSNEIPDSSPLPDLTQGIPSTLDTELAEAAARRQNRGREETQQSKPLPDLTQGIPSTLDAELAEAAAKRAQTDSLNVTEAPKTPEDETSTGGRGRGEPPKSEYISSIDRRRNRIAQITMGMLAAFALTGVVYLGRNWETEEEERMHPDAPSGWGFGLFYNRGKARLTDVTDYYNEPAFPKLLPDEDPQYKAPFTLVLSLEDLLVHSEWDREHGWRLAKRPGVDYFLRYLSQYYELVLFTSTPSLLADPVLRKLDPYRIIRWPLFREATRYKNGEYIKVCPSNSTLGSIAHAHILLGSGLPQPRYF